jgi:hypothetical protein
MAQGGGAKPTTSQTSSVTPWASAQPYLQNALGVANAWMVDPNSSKIYEGSTVVPFANQSLWGMNNAQNFAQTTGQNMQNQAGDIINAGGFNSLQQNANSRMLENANNPLMGQMASGQFLGQGNPYLQQALTNANERAATGVNSAMSAAGRYGSGTHTDTLGKTLAENSTNAMFGQYNQDVNNMMGAASQRMSAAGNLFNAGQQGLGNMQSAYGAAMMPGQTMGQIGGAYEDLAGKLAQEQLDKFNARKQAPMDAVAQANAIFTGSGQLGSNTSQKVYQPTQWGQVGANAAGAALAGK